VAGLERKNGWTLAQRAGEASLDGMQRLLRSADWDIGGVRDMCGTTSSRISATRTGS